MSGLEPYARLLQCLRCGRERWALTGAPSSPCPGCQPNGPERVRDADGRMYTVLVVAAELAPSPSFAGKKPGREQR
jgi:hypothetical protein